MTHLISKLEELELYNEEDSFEKEYFYEEDDSYNEEEYNKYLDEEIKMERRKYNKKSKNKKPKRKYQEKTNDDIKLPINNILFIVTMMYHYTLNKLLSYILLLLMIGLVIGYLQYDIKYITLYEKKD